MNRQIPAFRTTRSSLAARTESSSSSPHILIVDDDPFICGLYSLLLDQEGYETVTAENGEDALTQLASGEFDLLITDCTMPVLDGPGLILALRAAGNRIPVVMISGSLGDVVLSPAVASEICVTLAKPAHTKEILSAVTTALEISRVSERSDFLPEGLSTVAAPDSADLR